MAKKWTIGTVNYLGSPYFEWQFKSFFEYNDPEEFQIVIVDNSRDEEELARLKAFAAPYQEKYNNIKIIAHNPVEETASGQHGEGLTLILKEYADSTYIIFQDPDFFWVKKGILKWFESFFDKGYDAIGAPYPGKVGLGHPRFPSAWGCAHRVSDIKHLDLLANPTEEDRQQSFKDYPLSEGYEFSFDVGYKIRQELSTADNDENFISFDQKNATDLGKILGRYSFECFVKDYFYDNQRVAYHLFRGSFTGEVTKDQKDPQGKTPTKWKDARKKYAEFFYACLQNDGAFDLSLMQKTSFFIGNALNLLIYSPFVIFGLLLKITAALLLRARYLVCKLSSAYLPTHHKAKQQLKANPLALSAREKLLHIYSLLVNKRNKS